MQFGLYVYCQSATPGSSRSMPRVRSSLIMYSFALPAVFIARSALNLPCWIKKCTRQCYTCVLNLCGHHLYVLPTIHHRLSS